MSLTNDEIKNSKKADKIIIKKKKNKVKKSKHRKKSGVILFL